MWLLRREEVEMQVSRTVKQRKKYAANYEKRVKGRVMD
jgi:hypothetical protein